MSAAGLKRQALIAGSLLNEQPDGLGWAFRRTEQVGSECYLPSGGVWGKRLLSLGAVTRSCPVFCFLWGCGSFGSIGRNSACEENILSVNI